jgi:hypothetical protein
VDAVELGFDVGVEEVLGAVGAGEDGDQDVDGHVCGEVWWNGSMLGAVLGDADGAVSWRGDEFGHGFDWGCFDRAWFGFIWRV